MECHRPLSLSFFFFNDTATTEIYTLSLHDALPIWLSDRADNPNEASMLVLIDGLAAEDLSSFTRCVDLFDGNDPAAVEAARERWRHAQAAGHSLTYWQQTEAGWEKKA